MVAVTLAYA